MADDIVDYLLREFRESFPEASEETLSALEEKARGEWGGDEAYVAKKKIKMSQKQKAVTEYIGGKPIKDIKKNTGVGRATLYRHLKKA